MARSSPAESIISFKLGSVIKYATLFPGGFYSSAFGFFMNEDKWNKLSKEDQDAIMSVSGEALARLAGKAWDEADAAGIAEMKKIGIKIDEASPALIQGREGKDQAARGQVDTGRQRQGHRRRQGAGRVPRRGQTRRCGQVTELRAMASHSSEAGSWLDRVLGAAAALLLFGLMALTTVDVIGRYLFNWPLRGAFEITELLLLTLIFAGLPLASRVDEHVTLDFVDMLLGPKGRSHLRRAVDLVCGIICSLLLGAYGSRPARSPPTATPPTFCAYR